MQTTTATKTRSVLAALLVTASACGGDGDASTAASVSVPDTATATALPTLVAPVETTVPRTTRAPDTTAPTPPSTAAEPTTPAELTTPATYAVAEIDRTTIGDVITETFEFDFRHLSAGDPPGPVFIAYGAGYVWVAQHRAPMISQIDPVTGELVANFTIDPTPGSTTLVDPVVTGAATGAGSIYATDDAVWVLSRDSKGSGFVWRLDTATMKVGLRVDIPDLEFEQGVLAAFGKAWVRTAGGVTAFDAVTGEMLGTYPVEPPYNDWTGTFLVATDDSVWAGSSTGTVRIDPDSGAVRAAVDVEPLGFGGFPVGVWNGLVWNLRANSAWAIDPATNEIVAEIPVPQEPGFGAVDPIATAMVGDSIWTTAGPETGDKWAYLVRFDLATGEVTAQPYAVTGGYLVGMAATPTDLWITDWGRSQILRAPTRDT